MNQLIMSILSWFGSLIGQKPSDTPSGQPASLPSLPTSSVAAVGDAVVQVGRVIEQQTNLHNTPAMQQAAMNKQDADMVEKIKKDVANEDVNATRVDIAN